VGQVEVWRVNLEDIWGGKDGGAGGKVGGRFDQFGGDGIGPHSVVDHRVVGVGKKN